MLSLTLIHADCVQAMKDMEDGSIGSIVCDPPYDLTSVSRGGSSRTFVDNPYGRTRVGTDRGGFMGKTWDGTGIAFSPALWSEIHRVLAPGGVVKAFGGTRTFHRMTRAMREAGFVDLRLEAWTYGSGFPKSLNIGKAMDKQAGADTRTQNQVQDYIKERREAKGLSKSEVDKSVFGGTTRYSWVEGRGGERANEVYLPTPEEWVKLKALLDLDDRFDGYIKTAIPSREHRARADGGKAVLVGVGQGDWGYQQDGERWGGGRRLTAPATDAARTWDGWGTALKPAWEPVVVGVKP